MSAGPIPERLRAFRGELHACFLRRADALFELADAILVAGTIPSPVHLSLAGVHRRSWGSLYAALSKGRIRAEALRNLLADYPLENDGAKDTPVYAVDVTSWPRCDAECIAGLLLGKPLGIVGFGWVVNRLGWASAPKGLGLRELVGVGIVAGIGFTVSLFVAALAFEEPHRVAQAKVGVLFASIIAGAIGYGFLRVGSGNLATDGTRIEHG